MGEQDLRQLVLSDNEWNLLDQIKGLLHVRIKKYYLYNYLLLMIITYILIICM